MTGEAPILLTCDEHGVATLLLNRSAKLNAFTVPMKEQRAKVRAFAERKR